MKQTSKIIGIDLGTTNSEVAVLEQGRPVVIADSNGSRLLPSVVGLGDKGELLVGEAALNQWILYPERTVKSIKRKMGSEERVSLGGQSYTPQEISAMILRTLKQRAEAHLGQPVSQAVITVPAYFNDAQRQATREAGEIAGLQVVRIINEPTAAALVYESDLSQPRNILVYDLGGGTFDVSVVRIQAGVLEVIASHGDNFLGGDDFDQEVVALLVEKIRDLHELDVSADPKVMARLLRAAVAAKVELSDRPYVQIREEFLAEKDGIPLNFEMELFRDEYEALISPYIDRTLEALHIALEGADLTVADLDDVLLVGGATHTPLVQERLQETLGIAPQGALDPDLCVAMGAAVQAGMIGGEQVTSVLVDITPYTFGTSAFGELNGVPSASVYVPVIRKNSPLPLSKSEVFYTLTDGQSAVDVHVYQGEHPDADDNVLIGEFRVEGLRQAPAGDPIVVRFDLDLDGILHVTATEKATGLEKSVQINNAVGRMDREALTAARSNVISLFGESQTDHDDSVLQQAQALITRAEVLLDQVGEEDREELAVLLETARKALAKKDSGALLEPIEALTDILYYLDN